MCGIAGFTRFRRDETRLRQMGDSIAHRGPDAHGEYIDETVALAHRRLAIIDLSETGKQPMHSSCGRYVMVYNGEIYNYLELREDLEKDGHRFTGQSDSEVVLAMYGVHGQRCVDFLNGMFAVFGSEIKAILQAGDIDRSVRDASVKDFFTFQYVPDPHSIFTHIQKLPPAHSMLVSENDCHLEQYWDVSFKEVSQQSEAEIGEQLLEIVDDATRLRMVSDVPLGAFLSGGVDSSAVVALMSRHSSTPVTTCGKRVRSQNNLPATTTNLPSKVMLKKTSSISPRTLTSPFPTHHSYRPILCHNLRARKSLSRWQATAVMRILPAIQNIALIAPKTACAKKHLMS